MSRSQEGMKTGDVICLSFLTSIEFDQTFGRFPSGFSYTPIHSTYATHSLNAMLLSNLEKDSLKNIKEHLELIAEMYKGDLPKVRFFKVKRNYSKIKTALGGEP